MKLKEVLDRTVQFFKDKQIETPRLDSEILLTEALGYKNRVDLYLKFDQPLKDEELARSREFVRRRVSGEPVAYIIGRKEFYGLSFVVNSSVLIPRPETELLVEEALKWMESKSLTNPKILDLGCGSGCIGLSLLKKAPGAHLTAVDRSAEALQTARKNAEHLGLQDQVQFLEMDCFKLELEPASFDLILSNPPYIAVDDPEVQPEVKKFEPSMALFSGEQGFAALMGWSEKAISWLKPGGWMGFEMGASQSLQMSEHFANLGAFQDIRLIKDLAGYDRHIVGVKNG